MRKPLILFFAFIYLISISGVVISNFYCCGQFKKSSFFQNKIIAKDCKGKIEGPGCCDTKIHLIKVKDNHSPVDNFKVQPNKSDFNFTAELFTDLFSSIPFVNLNSIFHLPPLICKQHSYISQCVFRI